MKQYAMNPEPDGTCRTIKANYWKVSRANFLHTNSFGATGVIEVEDESDSEVVSGKTGGIRMKKMLDSGLINGVGQCIDLYNQTVYDDIFVTITTRIDHCNHYWVTVEQ